MKQLILGALEFQGLTQHTAGVEIFLKSLRKYYNGDVVFFTRNLHPTTKQLLDSFNIIQIDKTEFEQQHKIVRLGINATRRLYYYIWLQEQDYDQILMADIFDVVFQSDPFEVYQNPFYVHAFNSDNVSIISEEARKIGECPINSGWIQAHYGTDIFKKLCGKPILCAGLIFGNKEQTLNINKLFIDEVKSMYGRPGFGNLDQAHIEYLFHTKDFPKLIVDYLNDDFMHIGHTKNEDIKFDNGRILIEDRYPSIVHQYNRHQNIQTQLEMFYK